MAPQPNVRVAISLIKEISQEAHAHALLAILTQAHLNAQHALIHVVTVTKMLIYAPHAWLEATVY